MMNYLLHKKGTGKEILMMREKENVVEMNEAIIAGKKALNSMKAVSYTHLAPYSKEFYFISGNDIILIEDKKDLRRIILKKERG